jgi:CheY-like chemotaxis protein
VDDQPEHRQLMREILEPLGFFLEEAESGADCLCKVHVYQPDLILLDLSMRDMDGLEVAKQLRKNGYCLNKLSCRHF